MKLTRTTRPQEFFRALGDASMRSSIKAVGEKSHAAACGSLECLVFHICRLHPQAMACVNEYIARNQPEEAA